MEKENLEALEQIENKYPDRAFVKDFYSLSDEALTSLAKRIASGLDGKDIKFIRDQLCKSHRRSSKALPSLGELRLYGAIIAERKTLTESLRISEIETDSIYIKETYVDLLEKAKVLHKKNSFVPTLDAIASISGDYMTMIGRESDGTCVIGESSDKSKGSLSVMRSNGKNAFTFVEKADRHDDRRLEGGMALALLLPVKDCENEYLKNVKAFFVSAAKRSLCERRIPVASYGIVGALCNATMGAKADISRLPFVGDATTSSLATDFKGRFIIAFRPENLKVLRELAGTLSLSTVYFAKTAENNRIETSKSLTPAINVPMGLLSELRGYTVDASASIATPEFSAPIEYCDVSARSDVSFPEAITSALEWNEKIISVKHANTDKNAFAAGMFTAINLCTELVAKGINRRSICTVFDYEIPKYKTDPSALGASLTSILGTYRLNMELASPTAYVNIKYGSANRLICAAYASKPRAKVAEKITAEGNKLCFMSFARMEDGFPDFADYRRMCDKFFELAREGRVLSACAVNGALSEAVEKICGELEIKLNEVFEKHNATHCYGILFEVKDAKGLTEIGETVKKSCDGE